MTHKVKTPTYLLKYVRSRKNYKKFSLDDFFATTESFRLSSVPVLTQADIFKDKTNCYTQ